MTPNRREPAEVHALATIRQAEKTFWARVRAEIDAIMAIQARRRENWKVDNG